MKNKLILAIILVGNIFLFADPIDDTVEIIENNCTKKGEIYKQDGESSLFTRDHLIAKGYKKDGKILIVNKNSKTFENGTYFVIKECSKNDKNKLVYWVEKLNQNNKGVLYKFYKNSVNNTIENTVEVIEDNKKRLESMINNDVYSILNKYKNIDESKLLKNWFALSKQQNNDKYLSYFIDSTKDRIKYVLDSLGLHITDDEYAIIFDKIKNTKRQKVDLSLSIPNNYTDFVEEYVNIRILPIVVPYTKIKLLNKNKPLKLLYEINFTLDNKEHNWGYVVYDDEENKGWVNLKYTYKKLMKK